ncbi:MULTISPECIES: hypothetical protein [unclassified Enterococcus]|uniref:hypothetical protein n=1 Tax=unclassified Enterococcus TaxID=2608891 RepID=UPI0013EB0556|nr:MULTISPECIES: hypothetical protein [unclassified Enterococcus]
MEKMKSVVFENPSKKQTEIPTFIPAFEAKKVRTELSLGGFDGQAFSDSELAEAIQRKKRLRAATIVPVIIDWILEKNAETSNPSAIDLRGKETAKENTLKYQMIGERDFDAHGDYYLVVASSGEKRIESLFKVYTHGKVVEMWLDRKAGSL